MTVEAVAGELVINELHLQIGGLGIGHAIDGSGIKQLLCFVRVQYVLQTLFDIRVDRDKFTIRDS